MLNVLTNPTTPTILAAIVISKQHISFLHIAIYIPKNCANLLKVSDVKNNSYIV
jgi:hypothetical protein